MNRSLVMLVVPAVSAALFGITQPVNAQEAALRVVGSEVLAVAVNEWGKQYEKSPKGEKVIVTSATTLSGYKALLAGTADIAAVTEKPTDFSLDLDEPRIGKLNFRQVGSGGVAIVVNTKLPISELSLDRLSKIFTGEYDNWSRARGPNRTIEVCSLDPKEKGAGAWFQENVMHGKPFVRGVRFVRLTNHVVANVSTNECAVGVVSLGTFNSCVRRRPHLKKTVKLIRIKRSKTAPGVAPTEASIADMTYALTAPVYLCFDGSSAVAGRAKAFVEFSLEKYGNSKRKDPGESR